MTSLSLDVNGPYVVFLLYSMGQDLVINAVGNRSIRCQLVKTLIFKAL